MLILRTFGAKSKDADDYGAITKALLAFAPGSIPRIVEELIGMIRNKLIRFRPITAGYLRMLREDASLQLAPACACLCLTRI